LIRPVDNSLLEAVVKTTPTSPAQAGAAEANGKNAFAAQLKRAATAPEKKADTAAPADAKAADSKPTRAESRAMNRMEPPEDEKWRPVKGRDDYAEIIAGDRKGQYVNLNRGARRGEAFTIEEREGKTVHVYKKADGSELVVPIEDKKEARAAGTRVSDREPPKGETWGPVKGARAYADILSGPRNGYYVNLQQGSVREGEVFHIVKRGGKEFHVYGEGDDKVWVEVGATKKKKAEPAQADGTSTTPVAGAPDSRDAGQGTSGGATAPASGSGTTTV
jgi:hypothetical protein